MLAEIGLVLVSALAVIPLLLVIYARWHFGTLEKLGIPVVKTHWLLGSTAGYEKITQHDLDLEWYKEHGEIYGVYEGRKPQIHILDPEIVKQICIRDFDKFVNHNFSFGFPANSLLSQMMDFLLDDTWRVIRSAYSRAFTTAKLKKMMGSMNSVSKDCVSRVKADIVATENGVLENFNLYQEIFVMLTDLISRITMNIQIENPRDPNNEFAKAVRDLFSQQPPEFLKPFLFSFPFLQGILLRFAKETTDFFEKVFKQILAARKKSGERNNDDFVDLVGDLLEKTKSDSEFKRLGISDRTVIAQAVEFYIAGQDQMAGSMCFMLYHLAQHPEIEKKLYEEVEAYLLRNKGDVNHETLGELVYLNACLNETIRLHPSFTRPDRLCSQDVEYKGVKIPKGMTVIIPIWSYNRNPKNFPDPEKFDPERYMPSNKNKLDPMATMSFGHGPRMCIGMKFALECMTVATIYFIKNFRFKIKPDYKPTYLPGIIFAAMLFEVQFDVSARKQE